MARDDRPPATLAWTAARVLLLGALVALGVTIWLLSRPLVNPGVQDCGTAAGFVFDNRESVTIRPGDVGAPPNAADLAAQPTCRDLVDLQLRRAAIAGGAFFALGFLGAVIGLVDDRVAYHRAPTFESLLRPLPEDAPVRRAQRVRMDEAELESDLPPVEPPQVVGFAAATAIGIGLVVVAAGVGDTSDALGRLSAGGLVLGVLAVVAGMALGAVERVGVYDKVTSFVRAVEVVLAAAWQARIRPLVAWYGLDFHHLRTVGSPREEADAEVSTLQGLSLVAHVVVLVPAVLLALGDGATDQWTRGVLALGLLTVIVVLGSLPAIPVRVAGLPMRPGRTFVATLRDRAGTATARVALGGAAALGRPLADGVALAGAAAAVGGGVGAARLIAVAAVATVVSALTPIPSGAGVVEGTVFVGLVAGGMAPGPAAIATIGYRALTCWLPMLPGLVASRRLAAAGAL